LVKNKRDVYSSKSVLFVLYNIALMPNPCRKTTVREFQEPTPDVG